MENNLITVVLPIEVKGREFDSRLLLAYHLVKQGYNVVIGDRAGVERETKYTQNCIYIAKSLAYSQQEMYENFHSKTLLQLFKPQFSMLCHFRSNLT